MIKDKKITLGAIAKALALGEFVFFYQPVLSLVTGSICGAEALIRWQRSDGSLVPASMFIPLAEKTGFITEITQTMLPVFLADMMTIHQFNPLLTVALNLSVEDLATGDFSESILYTIQAQKLIINPRKFRIEITESQAMTLTDRMRNTLFALDAEGVQIAIDDFGTGYTSLALLRDLPITAVKIDRSFVSKVLDSEKCAKIVYHIISLAHQLGLETVSEGVETQAVLDWLQSYGSTCAQGFHIGVPLSFSNFLAFLSQNHQRLAAHPLGLIHLAKQGHLDWQHDLISGVLKLVSVQDKNLKEDTYERIPDLDPTKCLLGKWYNSARQEFGKHPQVEQLRVTHEQLHEAATHLVQIVSAGASREQVAESIYTLNKYSEQVLRLLSELHTIISLENERIRHKPGNNLTLNHKQPALIGTKAQTLYN